MRCWGSRTPRSGYYGYRTRRQSGTGSPGCARTASPKWLVENRELIRSVKSIDASELFGEGSELTFALDRETKRPVVRVVEPADR